MSKRGQNPQELDQILDAAYIDTLLALLDAVGIESATNVSAMRRLLFTAAFLPGISTMYNIYGEEDDAE